MKQSADGITMDSLSSLSFAISKKIPTLWFLIWMASPSNTDHYMDMHEDFMQVKNPSRPSLPAVQKNVYTSLCDLSSLLPGHAAQHKIYDKVFSVSNPLIAVPKSKGSATVC